MYDRYQAKEKVTLKSLIEEIVKKERLDSIRLKLKKEVLAREENERNERLEREAKEVPFTLLIKYHHYLKINNKSIFLESYTE